MSYRFKVFLNMMISLVILAINITILFLWFQLLRGAILPQLHGTAWLIGKILFGWWLTGVIASFLYDAETYAWDSVSSASHQVIPFIFIILMPLEKMVTGEGWSFYWNRQVLASGPIPVCSFIFMRLVYKVAGNFSRP